MDNILRNMGNKQEQDADEKSSTMKEKYGCYDDNMDDIVSNIGC